MDFRRWYELRWVARDRAPSGTIETVPGVHSPELGNTRDLLVYLPGSYADGEARYPVIYMHDGQNLFDPATSFAGSWDVHEAMAAAALDGVEAIVVGIPNMGADRIDEYGPFAHPQLGGGRGADYLRFLAGRVKPLIDARYRTRPGRGHTALVGSSMGGLISLYGFFRAPQVFGAAGVMSPSLWLSEDEIFAFVRAAPFTPGRLYLDVGDLEGERHVDAARRLYDLLRAKGYREGTELRWVEDAEGRHNEASWARRFRAALPFLLGQRVGAGV